MNKNRRWFVLTGTILYLVILFLVKELRPWNPKVIYYEMADLDRGIMRSFCNWNPLVEWDTIQFHWKSYLANVVLLLPGGFLASYFVRSRTIYWTLGIGGCILLEILQLIMRTGVFDILTVILEIIGYTIGYGIFCMMKRYSLSDHRI